MEKVVLNSNYKNIKNLYMDNGMIIVWTIIIDVTPATSILCLSI